MRELSLLAACATLAVIGSAALPSAKAMAQECLPEMSPDAPPPTNEDGCDEVGNPEEGGTDNPPPPPPPPGVGQRAALLYVREAFA
jgi:hypothetical protein